MKYIIFDFDGTIGDSQRLIVKTLQDTMRERGLEVKSDEACAKTIGLRLDEAFVALFGMSAEEGEACAATYREIFMKNKEIMIVEPFPHVIETLRKLHQRGFVLGVASSRNHCSLDGYVRQMALNNIFTSIVAGDDVEHVKPAPDMVLEAIGQLGVKPKDCVYVGDSDVDILTAQGAGLPCISVLWGFRDREFLLRHGATTLAAKPSDIVDIMDSGQVLPHPGTTQAQ